MFVLLLTFVILMQANQRGFEPKYEAVAPKPGLDVFEKDVDHEENNIDDQ